MHGSPQHAAAGYGSLAYGPAGHDGSAAAEVSRPIGLRTKSPHKRSASRGNPHSRAFGDRVSEAVDAKASQGVDAKFGEAVDARLGEAERGKPIETATGNDSANLDRRLRALSGRASRCRLIEGWLARDLLARRKWQPLGFARLGDYTRERLGIGARCLEEEVRVARALRNLPRITSAFLDGDLSWTTVRVLTGVASTGSEPEWIDKARSLSSRALTALVRATLPTSTSTSTQPPTPSAATQDDEEDLPQRWSVRVSHRGGLLWRAASELAQRMAGSTLTPAQVLELVAAEAGAGPAATGDLGDRIDPDCLALLERLRRGIVDAAAPHAAHENGRGSHTAAARSRATAAPAVPGRTIFHEEEPPSPKANESDAPGDARNTTTVGQNVHAGEGGRDVHAGGAGQARSLSEVVTESIRRGGDRPLGFLTEDAARDLEEHDPVLAAFYLEEIASDAVERAASGNRSAGSDAPAGTIPDPAWFENLIAELSEAEGFAWMAALAPALRPTDWLEAEFARLDTADPHTIDTRLREVRRALQGCEFELAALLREAADRRLYRNFHFANFELYVETRLGLSARTAWSLLAVEKATRRSCPMLGQAWHDGRVSWLAAKILAPVVSSAHGAAWIERAQVVTLRRLEAEIAWAQDCRDQANSYEYPAPPPLDLNLDLNLNLGDILANTAANTAANTVTNTVTIDGLQMRAQVPGPNEPVEAYHSCVQIEFFVPVSVVELAEETMLRLHSGSEPRGRVFERMLALAMLEWLSAPAHRNPVFARDGWRCAVPGCTSRRNLHVHHIVFRSLGGGNERDNRITVCAAHHLHGLHRGRIRAHGAAPRDIVWEIGCRFGDGGGPLARLFGDRFV